MSRHRVAPVLAAVLAAVLTAASVLVVSVVMISSAPTADAVGGCMLTDLRPDGLSSPIHTEFTATAELTGVECEGITIDFEVIGKNPRRGSGITDASGTAKFPYTGRNIGWDEITATWPVIGLEGRISRTIKHEWTEPPPPPKLVITASPNGTSGLVGSDFVVRAFVSANGKPVGRADVTMESTMATPSGQSTITRSDTTDASGRVAFNYTRDVAGRDTVRITARWSNQTASATLTRTWTTGSSPPPTSTTPTTPTSPTTPTPTTPTPGTDPTSPTPPASEPTTTPTPRGARLGLSPDGVVSKVGADFTVTAKLTSSSGDPIPGQLVRFVTTKQDALQITKSATTGEDGTARFTYSRDRPGPDIVRASADVEGTVVRAQIDHRWSSDQQPPGEQGTLKPDESSVRPGGDLTLTGTGCPAGERVDISVNDRSIATTRADETGAYKVVAAVPDLSPGRYRVVASCSDVTADATVDVVAITSMTGTAAASGLTGAAVLVFFVLLGSTLVRRLAAPDGDAPAA